MGVAGALLVVVSCPQLVLFPPLIIGGSQCSLSRPSDSLGILLAIMGSAMILSSVIRRRLELTTPDKEKRSREGGERNLWGLVISFVSACDAARQGTPSPSRRSLRLCGSILGRGKDTAFGPEQLL